MKILFIFWWINDYSFLFQQIKSIKKESPDKIRSRVVNFYNTGRIKDLIMYLQEIEDVHGNLMIDNTLPSLYSYRGVLLASHAFHDQEGAIQAFKNATFYNPKDTRSWINLGEVYMQSFKFAEAYEALVIAERQGEADSYPRLLKVMSWTARWKDFERISYMVELEALQCYRYRYHPTYPCKVDSTNGMEYTNVNGTVMKLFHSRSPHSRSSSQIITKPMIDFNSMIKRNKSNNNNNNSSISRLKVAFISSDFGVHPVSMLIRGGLTMIDSKRIEVFCFAINSNISYWGTNISKSIEHFIVLESMNTYDSASLISSYGIHILIDLNGHTLNTGLQLMNHKPAYIQLSYLGLPTTTGAEFIDYYLADSISLPIEHRDHFSEKLLYIPPCYIVNDYAQMQGDIIYLNQQYRSSRQSIQPDVSTESASVLFATLSNSQKFDPFTFIVWMNILNRVYGSKMVFLEYQGTSVVVPNLRNYSKVYGIHPDRIVKSAIIPWIDHLHTKTAYDMILDTTLKNGHTTGLDGLWAGVPTISLAGGKDMSSRAAESMANVLGSELGLGYSLKEYEDVVIRFTTSNYFSYSINKNKTNMIVPWRLRLLREYSEKLRMTSNLFNTSSWSINFVHMMEASWEAYYYSQSQIDINSGRADNGKIKLFHIFAQKPQPLKTWPQDSSSSSSQPKKQILTGTASLSLLREEYLKQPHVHISQAVEGGIASWWAASDQVKLSFQKRYGYDPEIFYRRVNNNSHNHNNNGSDSNDSSDDKQKRNRKVGKYKHYKGWSDIQSKVYTLLNSSISPINQLVGDADIQTNIITEKNGDDSMRSNIKRSFHFETMCKEFILKPVPAHILNQDHILLNIGGYVAQKDWINVNSVSTEDMRFNVTDGRVDIIRHMHNLEGFATSSVTAIYASHILEHNSFGDGMLSQTLKEWRRVLRPGGLLFVAVPDITTLAELYLNTTLTLSERVFVLKMMFGAQVDAYDYHKVGFNEELLTVLLNEHDFCDVQRVNSFNLFSVTDTSESVYKGRRISLNLIAKACSKKGVTGKEEVLIKHKASPYTQ